MKCKVLAIVLMAAMLLPNFAGPASAATQGEINQAIQDGLAWLAAQQHPTGGYFGSGGWPNYYYLANTATAVLAFENEGHFPGGGTIYSSNVEKGLDFLFNYCYKRSISTQPAGDPDTNGNGLGIYFRYNSEMYETGLVMQAIVASNTPSRVVTAGACAGMTYAEVMTDLVDYVAWGQIDGGLGRGGWRYSPNYTSYADNSVAQWPVLGLIAAEQWGIYAPQFVKNELEYWVTYIQHPSGGSGYHTPSTYVNISKTGGLLVEFYYLGDDATTPRVKSALNYVDSRWGALPSGAWYGNKGHPYAMFSVFKGLELLQVPTVPSAPANTETPAGDWWGDYSEYLVNTQNHPTSGQGYWDGYYYWGPYLATPWYIIILQATVFPISVDVEVPGAACDLTGYEVNVHYSVERFTANGELRVYRDNELYDTVILTDFIGSATVTYDIAPETVGDHTWKAVLDVIGGGITTQAEDIDTSSVYATPQVAGIPDQVAPFTSFDLDDFQTCECDNVDWSASGVPAGWTVTIDTDHVVTVTAPEGAYEPADITFTAVFHWPGIDCEDSDTATFSPNRPPVPDPGKDYFAGEKYYVDEGGTVILDGTGSYDPDGDAITYYAWDLDEDGTFEAPGATTTFSAAGLDGPSEVYVYLKVCDEHGACAVGLAEVEIENVAPTIDAINAPSEPVNINDQPVSVEVFFSDPGIPDTHEVTWEWDDGNSDTQSGVTSPASAGHSYAEAGIYTITLTVTDDDGGLDTNVYQYIVVYDPSAGFVTGGGWIDSPPGAYYPATDSYFDGSFYELVFSEEWLYWAEARDAAASMTVEACDSAHLATVTSEAEQEVIAELMEPLTLNAWIGGFQEEDELNMGDNWQWVTGELWSYTNWADGEPNDNPWGTYVPGSEQHLEVYQVSGFWNDAPGDPEGIEGGEGKHFYIVEYEGCDPGPTGKANFGFVSKYKKGADTPTGNTEFQFHAADLNFHSSSYEWLVVTGSNYARFKGVGTVNGMGEYKFMLWAGDGTGTDGEDTFRIKIWEEDEFGVETVIYDNGMDQDIAGGSIVVHTKK